MDVFMNAAFAAMQRRFTLANGDLNDNAAYEDPFVADLYRELVTAGADRWDVFRCGFGLDPGEETDLVELCVDGSPGCAATAEVKLWLLDAYLNGKMLATWRNDIIRLRGGAGRSRRFVVWASDLGWTFDERRDEIEHKLGLRGPCRASNVLPGWTFPTPPGTTKCSTRVFAWEV